jgi:hypothetical protein
MKIESGSCKCILVVLVLCFFSFHDGFSQRLRVSDNQRFIVKENGDPFFWLADTAWELFHRCNRQEAEMYLKTRAAQGFNVIQAVALAEIDGLNTPNPYGETPLINNDPATPNDAYFEHVDYIISKAEELGLYIALLPTWGDKLFRNSWGIGPEVLNPENARTFGEWIGQRYHDNDHIIWVIGGDRNPREGSNDVLVWNAMAEGIAASAGGYQRTLMSFHPQPKALGGSSTWFHDESWLDFNMHQTGHCANKGTYKHIQHDYNLTPVKPVLDGEPLYEDHPNCFRPEELGHSVPEDIRRIMYWNIFAGACGQTYGCHDVWQMFKQGRDPINKPLRPWPEALNLPMANQVKHLKHLMLSRPYLSRVPDQSLIVGSQKENEHYTVATRDVSGSYAMIYFPTGRPTGLNLTSLKGDYLHCWWYDPRTGASFESDQIRNTPNSKVTPPSSGEGNDWVLVIDSMENEFGTPGK